MTTNKDPLELDYIPAKVSASRKEAKSFATITLHLIMGFVVLLILWASFFSLNEVTRGQGKVISSRETQVINNLEGGIIRGIHVKEGQLVEPGQLLISIDKSLFASEFEGSQTQYLNLLSTASRLKAQIDGTDFVVPEKVQKEAPLVAAQEVLDFHDRQKQIKNQLEIADDQILQKQQELAQAQSDIDFGKVTLSLLKEELSLIDPLVRQELISKRDVLRLKRDIQQTDGKIRTAEISIPRLNAALEEARDKKEQVMSDFKIQDIEKLQEIEVRLADAESRMETSENKLSRTDIKAPLKGIVNDVKIHTIGEAIQPGQELAEIVPYEDTLVIEARISPSDVAFVHPGLKAIFKISSYDYSIYGGIDAEVTDISADTFEDKNSNPVQTYYRVFLKTKTNYLVHEGKKLPILPGMSGEINIVTGEHTIMRFLLKPIIKGMNRSFGER